MAKETNLTHKKYDDLVNQNKINEDILKTKIKQQESVSYLSGKALSGIEINSFLDLVVKEIHKVLNIELVKVLELVTEKEFRIKAAIGLQKNYKLEYPIEASEDTHAGYSLLHNKPIVLENLKEEKRFKGSQLLADHKIISGISVIIKSDSKSFGVLTAHSKSERTFTKDDISFFASIANLISLVLARKKAERFLNLYQERFYHAQKAGQIGLFDWNMISGDLWWSEEQYELVGAKPDKAGDIQANLAKSMFPEDLIAVRKQIDYAKKNKKEMLVEYRVKDKDGSIRWLKSRGKIYFDRRGKPVRALGVTYDTTERKRIEDSLSFLSESSKVLSSSLDFDKTLQTVAKIAVPKVADWCAIDLISDSGKIELKAVAHVNPSKVKWAVKYRSQNPPNMDQETGLAKVIKTGKPEFYPFVPQSLLTNLNPEEEKTLKKIGGITAAIIVPLKSKRKVIGALTMISSESKKRFTEFDLGIAEQIADRASVAVENAILYQNVNDERKRLNHLLYNVPGVVWERWTTNGSDQLRQDFTSKYIEKMTGYTPEEMEDSKKANLLIHSKDRRKVSDRYKEMMKTGVGGIFRARWVSKKGKIMWVESHTFVVKNEKGKAIGMRGVSMDITDRVEIEKRKDEFISMASHELKTPLTSMKVFSHLLEKKLNNSEEANPYLSRMDEQINKLTNLVNDLLDISKIQAGKLEIRKQEISLKDFLEESIKEMELITNEQIIVGKVDDVMITADKDRLSQVLMNLISNAIKYSPPGTPVEVRAVVENNDIVFAVSDKGFGISKEHQGKIFDRFYRVYDHVDRTYPGLGMGLYISDQIVRRHNGSMWLDSEKGKGSTFYFSVPTSN